MAPPPGDHRLGFAWQKSAGLFTQCVDIGRDEIAYFGEQDETPRKCRQVRATCNESRYWPGAQALQA